MFTGILIAAIVSIQFLSVHSDPVEKCLGGVHKEFPSPEGPGFATCLQWKAKSCCSAETTEKLKKNGYKNQTHINWKYCGALSEKCKQYLMNWDCFYYCDPNLMKWQTTGRYISGVPICSDTCDKGFEACKNDRTYSKNWLNDNYAFHHSQKGPIAPDSPCRTFADYFQDGEGLCSKMLGTAYKYERSSNCMVFDFEGKNPNDEVVPT